MAIGALMIIPKVAKAIESALAGRPFDYEQAISEPISKTTGTVTSLARGGAAGAAAHWEQNLIPGTPTPPWLQALRTMGIFKR